MIRNLPKNMLTKDIICFLVVILSAFYGGAALHAADSPLISELAAFKVVIDEEGDETLTPASEAKPGDIIEYHCTYTNVGGNTLRDIRATLPIPYGLEYVEHSARPGRFFASLNGSKFQEPPLYKTVIDDSGKSIRVKAAPDEYRALQWYIGLLNNGDVRILKARAMISKP
jgi:uncharacterized repeat protein (TIGR01451 family)